MKADTSTLVGQKFGQLTVLSFSHTTQVQHSERVRVKYWFNCICDCGTAIIVSRASLPGTKTCGCSKVKGYMKASQKQKGKARLSIQKPNGEAVLNSYFLSYQNGAKKRGLSFNLSKEAFIKLTSENCLICGAEPREIKKKPKDFVSRKMNGIDRIDSDIGYEPRNCIPCCKKCNLMKLDLPMQEFLEHINKIHDFGLLQYLKIHGEKV